MESIIDFVETAFALAILGLGIWLMFSKYLILAVGVYAAIVSAGLIIFAVFSPDWPNFLPVFFASLFFGVMGFSAIKQGLRDISDN